MDQESKADPQPPPGQPDPVPENQSGQPPPVQSAVQSAVQSGQPPPVQSGQPPPVQSGQPPPLQYGQPPPQPGYQSGQPPPPPGYQPGQPPPPPGYQPGEPPPPPGYHPGLGLSPGAPGFLSALAHNMPQKEVVWMPLPTGDAPIGCPPGLEYLTQIDQILVNQQIELLELVTNFETENKYIIRNTVGQQVYFAREESSVFQRQCCGYWREFSMSITDNTQREVIRLERPLRPSCFFCFCPNKIEIQAPPGTVVGYVKQDALGIIHPWFSILNADEETILRIKGPLLGCSCYSDTNFLVLSSDGNQEVGKITKQWGGIAREFLTDADNFGIQYLDVKMKAVMMGACFLIDFMFFENQGSNNNQRRRR